jgi:hypothetical protein
MARLRCTRLTRQVRGDSRERRGTSCPLKPGALNDAEICLDERRGDRLTKEQLCLELDETVERRASPFLPLSCTIVHTASLALRSLVRRLEGKALVRPTDFQVF